MIQDFKSNSKFLLNNPWDIIIVGAGAAGLMSALELPQTLQILLINRCTNNLSSSRWAQGGISSVTRPEDSESLHAEDTFNAGAGLCDANAVEMFVREAPNCVKRLMDLGMEFDKHNGKLSTTLEAAHSRRRVLHVQDRTGRALVEVLQEQVDNRENIYQFTGVRATQLWVEGDNCCGLQILSGLTLSWIPSRAVILATGGGSHLFKNTTNPSQACGEGIALAWNAGAEINDLEFVQFHPTALMMDGAPCFLLSEALRGEGAFLVDHEGNSPVSHLIGMDLAPRDEVSRAIFKNMKSKNVNNVFLDLRNIGSEKIIERFPTIFNRCKLYGIDPLNQLIPVAPAAHYCMGGVATDLYAQTSLPGLFAVGEVASTGLHGANRLASNSLMECLVFARKFSNINLQDKRCKDIKEYKYVDFKLNDLDIHNADFIINQIQELREIIWKNAGVDRNYYGLSKALADIKQRHIELKKQSLFNIFNNCLHNQVYNFPDSQISYINLLIDLYNRQITSILMLEACLFRRESRGGHFRSDYPSSVLFWKCHSLQKLGESITTKSIN